MSKDFELKVIVKPIYYIEMVSLLHRLVNDIDCNELQVKPEHNELLNLLKGFRIRGLELFELFLHNESLDDIDALKELLADIDKTDFLYLLFGEEISKEEIRTLREGFDAFEQLPQMKKLLQSYAPQSLRFVFENTGEFIEKLMDIFKVLDTAVVKQLSWQDSYSESLQKIRTALKSKIPLDVAQGIMGKRFVRVYDFSTYYFVPSYFYLNRPMRTFNHKTQLLICPIGEVNTYNKSTLANALRVIADNTRLEIIERLAARPMYGKELAQELGIVTSTVSHHLEQLRTIGLIHEEREKSVKYFSINTNEYNKLCDALKNFINQNKTR